jgi:hypothetical protein
VRRTWNSHLVMRFWRATRELLAASREHAVLMLPGVTQMVWRPPVIAGMLRVQAGFFRRWLAAGA